MLLIDVISEITGEIIAVSQSGEFIFLASKEPVPAATLEQAQEQWAELDKLAKIEEINTQVREMIAEQYPMREEIKLLRLAPCEEYTVYNEHAEACRQWGREQKAALGLLTPAS